MFNQLATFTFKTQSDPYLNKARQKLFYIKREKDSKQNENITKGIVILIM